MPYSDPLLQKKYVREWAAKRRKIWFDENGPCVFCGSYDNLELDHIDKTKKISHRIWTWTAIKREIELAKCQVLCKQCHLRKTLSERPHTEHGKIWMYQRYRCRCSMCREVKRLDDKKRRAKPRVGDGNRLESDGTERS